MNRSDPPVSEEELHAYVDGQLASARIQAVQRYLAQNPIQAKRVGAWSAQRESLRDVLNPLAHEPLPPILNLSHLIGERLQPRPAWPRMAAAVVLALAAGATIGWFSHVSPSQSRAALAMTLLEQQAVATYTVYAPDKRHPIEVPASERAHLAYWLSNRLQRSVAAPKLESLGLRLIGGRLLATEHGGAAALFLYENSEGNRIGVIFRPMSPGLHAGRTDLSSGHVNGWAWINGGLGYAVVAPLPDAVLNRVANQMESESAPG